MGPLGFNEILIILVIVLLLFGGRKIPELMRGLGRGIREFNDAKSNVRREIEEGISEKEQKSATTTPPTSSESPDASTSKPKHQPVLKPSPSQLHGSLLAQSIKPCTI